MAKGQEVSYDEIYQNVIQRDLQDTTRKESPLTKASDAFVLDNSNMTPEQQMEWFVMAAEPSYMKDHPLMKQGQDLRPHMPKILEIMGPLVEMIASELKAFPDPMHTARFVPHLEDIAAEMREMYLLSMSIAKTEVEAEQLYQRVLATERAVKELRTKR